MSKIAVNEITDEQGTGRPAFTNGVQTSNINGGQVGGRRNLIINGAMQVAQRGTSVSGSTLNFAYLTVDRWSHLSSGSTYNSSQESVDLGGETGLPVNFSHYFRFNPTTGADNTGVMHFVEDVRKVQGTCTLSFYAKGTNPNSGFVQIELRQQISETISADAKNFSFELNSNWQRYEFTFTPASLSGQSVDNATSSYRIFFRQPSSDNSTDAWTLDITGVQLEVGDTATEFEHRSYGEELALCQRYYIRWGFPDNSVQFFDETGGNSALSTMIASGFIHDPDDSNISASLPITMRARPSVFSSGLLVINKGLNIFNDNTFVQENNCSKNKFSIFIDSGTINNVGSFISLFLKDPNSSFLALDAEL